MSPLSFYPSDPNLGLYGCVGRFVASSSLLSLSLCCNGLFRFISLVVVSTSSTAFRFTRLLRRCSLISLLSSLLLLTLLPPPSLVGCLLSSSSSPSPFLSLLPLLSFLLLSLYRFLLLARFPPFVDLLLSLLLSCRPVAQSKPFIHTPPPYPTSLTLRRGISLR
ncbi:hypothetical protein C8J56DRAFT_391899 [Mycena floridula]|nr:hypothetical protein C8J56DRAFT_391899 [Mycena floridula]